VGPIRAVRQFASNIRHSALFTRFAGLILVLGAAAASIVAIDPPAPRPIDAPPTEYSAERAASHLRAIAQEPHPIGSAAHDSARAYVVRAFTELGLKPRIVEGRAAARVAGTVFSAHVESVVARLQGARGSGKAVALVAHYDTVPQSFGASDDTSGIATLLETARALKARPPLDNDVLFLATDGEEMALLGAQTLLEDPSVGPHLGVVLNFEARGVRGAVAMYDPSPESGELVRILAEVAARPITGSFLAALAQALPNDSDVAVFKRAGIPALGFAYADGLEHYHRHTDDLAHLDLASLEHDGSYALSMADALGRRDLATIKARDIAYFDLFGRLLVRYPFWAARLLATCTVGLGVLLVRAGLRQRLITGRGLVIGAGLFLGGVALAGIAAGIGQVAAGLVIQDFFRLALQSKRLAWQAVLLSTAVITALWGRSISRGRGWDIAFGTLSVWTVVLVAVAVFAPGLTPPLQWPLLGSWLGTGTAAFRREPAAIYLGALPGAVLLGAVVYSVAVAVGATMAFAPALFFAFGAGLLAPALARLDWLTLRILAGSALMLAIADTVAAVETGRYGTSNPRTDSLVYGIDADQGTARFFSYDSPLDPYVAQYLDPSSSTPLPAFTRVVEPLKWTAAPVEKYTRNDLNVLSDETKGGTRTLAVRIRVSPGVRCVHVWDEGDSVLRASSIDGAPVLDVFRFSPERDETLFRLMTGDTSRRGFRMHHCALSPDGSLTVVLEARPGARVKLRVVSERSGLPVSVAARGRNSIPAQESDISLVSSAFTL
jgi:hypothetical protein